MDDGFLQHPAHAQYGHLGRVDNGRETVYVVCPKVGDGERAAGHFFGPGPAFPHLGRQLPGLRRYLGQSLPMGVPEDWCNQPLIQRYGYADVDVRHDLVAIFSLDRVETGMVFQAPGGRLDHQGQGAKAVFGPLAGKPSPEGHGLGDVGL